MLIFVGTYYIGKWALEMIAAIILVTALSSALSNVRWPWFPIRNQLNP